MTSERLLVHCDKFDKGGGWFGSPGAMVIANTISAVAAASRRRGKTLLGHIRHDWISTVQFEARRGFLRPGQLILYWDDAVGRAGLHLIMHSSTDPAVAAWNVVRVAGESRGHNPEEPPVTNDDAGGATIAIPNASPVPTHCGQSSTS